MKYIMQVLCGNCYNKWKWIGYKLPHGGVKCPNCNMYSGRKAWNTEVEEVME